MKESEYKFEISKRETLAINNDIPIFADQQGNIGAMFRDGKLLIAPEMRQMVFDALGPEFIKMVALEVAKELNKEGGKNGVLKMD